jgi:type IV fimbrial biogenesis protein FimT
MVPVLRLAGQASSPPRERGLTLIELMVGLAVMAIAMALSAPQFSQWGRGTRVVTQGADIQNSLAYARSESLRRGVRVAVCRSAEPRAASPACTAGNWADGWLVFIDNVHVTGNAAGAVDGTDTVLRIGDTAAGSAIEVTGNLGGWVAYSPQGLVRTAAGPANGSFRVCQSPHGRRITLNGAGLATAVTEVC